MADQDDAVGNEPKAEEQPVEVIAGESQQQISDEKRESVVPEEKRESIVPEEKRESIVPEEKRESIVPEEKIESVVPEEKRESIAESTAEGEKKDSLATETSEAPPVFDEEPKAVSSKVQFAEDATEGESKLAEAARGDAGDVASARKRRQSMFDDKGFVPEPEKKGHDLTGMLQNLFTQIEAKETATLKPVRRPKLTYENTYRLEPYKRFSSDLVQSIIQKTLEEMLEKTRYKSEKATALAQQIAEKIRHRVLALRFDRYKILALVTIGPLNRQGQQCAFRGMWDATRDTYATYTFINPFIYCNTTVFGIYLE